MARGDRVKLENADWCKNCGICISVCPTNVLIKGREGRDRVKIDDLEKCIGWQKGYYCCQWTWFYFKTRKLGFCNDD
jgi:2-oxoglutarate ferredoxin oxidoreductase subunit delta